MRAVFLGIFVVCFAEAFWKQLHDAIPPNLNPLNLVYTNRCVEDLGCFYTGPPFYHPLNRPLSLPPTSSPKVKFQLFSNANNRTMHVLKRTKESLQASPFDASLPTKFLIHGFRSDLDAVDIRWSIRNALLDMQDMNVFVVDWTANNGPPYSQALSNTRVIGAVVARLIKFLMKEARMKPEDVHIIGHSLGAHVSGYAGERIKNIGRITGLDPAGPGFQDAPKEVRLDPSDADFVDVIHTDGGDTIVHGFGIGEPLGHIDFYPNGGWRQAGCALTSNDATPLGGAFNFTTKWIGGTCDHERANTYFLESINNKRCKFMAVQCSSYENFEAGKCPPGKSVVQEMGYNAKRNRRIKPPAMFFLRTNPEAPFCRQDSIYI